MNFIGWRLSAAQTRHKKHGKPKPGRDTDFVFPSTWLDGAHPVHRVFRYENVGSGTAIAGQNVYLLAPPFSASWELIALADAGQYVEVGRSFTNSAITTEDEELTLQSPQVIAAVPRTSSKRRWRPDELTHGGHSVCLGYSVVGMFR